MELSIAALSQNESFARSTVAAFVSQIDPTMEELTELKTVVSEAVTNAIIHGYDENPNGRIFIQTSIEEDVVTLTITDQGKGIPNIQTAMEPLYTSKPELERSGMGFTIMENFMDEVSIQSTETTGTTVFLKKWLTKSTLPSN